MKLPLLLTLAGLAIVPPASTVLASPDKGVASPAFSPAEKAAVAVQSNGTVIGTTYCSAVANSTGQPADLTVLGSDVATDDNVVLQVTGLPTGSFGVFLTAREPGLLLTPAGSMGNACMRRSLGRFAGPGQVKLTDVTGTMTLDTSLGEWSTQAIPRLGSFYVATVGQRTHFQLWYRDLVGGRPTTNFSDGEYVDWQ